MRFLEKAGSGAGVEDEVAEEAESLRKAGARVVLEMMVLRGPSVPAAVGMVSAPQRWLRDGRCGRGVKRQDQYDARPIRGSLQPWKRPSPTIRAERCKQAAQYPGNPESFSFQPPQSSDNTVPNEDSARAASRGPRSSAETSRHEELRRDRARSGAARVRVGDGLHEVHIVALGTQLATEALLAQKRPLFPPALRLHRLQFLAIRSAASRVDDESGCRCGSRRRATHAVDTGRRRYPADCERHDAYEPPDFQAPDNHMSYVRDRAPLSPFRLPSAQLHPLQPITPGAKVPATTLNGLDTLCDLLDRSAFCLALESFSRVLDQHSQNPLQPDPIRASLEPEAPAGRRSKRKRLASPLTTLGDACPIEMWASPPTSEMLSRAGPFKIGDLRQPSKALALVLAVSNA
ncbi:hypothetical protein B0H15DRAFT_955127 [Mycena belliarum]|uniref:Uncharacterized protein n=1 Tax=Mycena belliarum TaxID=1033014 RepID=A0AAD6TX92_9AGAR|nr:hypothetical protein B0H15DRAFT_955127 [Mycena belliae]